MPDKLGPLPKKEELGGGKWLQGDRTSIGERSKESLNGGREKGNLYQEKKKFGIYPLTVSTKRNTRKGVGNTLGGKARGGEGQGSLYGGAHDYGV